MVNTNTQLLIITEPSQDRLAIELKKMLKSNHGLIANLLCVEDAAQLFTITTNDRSVTVDPEIPILWRFMDMPDKGEDFASKFKYAESISMLYGVTNLIKSRCVNRPSYTSYIGRYYYPLSLNCYLSTLEPISEVFCKSPKIENFQDSSTAIIDMVTFDSSVLPKLPEGRGPYMMRQISPNLEYAEVVVVGNESFYPVSNELDCLDIGKKSVGLLNRLELEFGVITWQISKDRMDTILTRVNPFPTFLQVEYAWEQISEKLLEVLFS